MSIFSQIFKALQTGTAEMGEAVVDANAIALFEKELEEANTEFNKMRDTEIQVSARKKQAEVKSQNIQAQITALEDSAFSALNEKDEARALELADDIVQMQYKLSNALKLQERWSANHQKIVKQVKYLQEQVNDMTHQLNQVKATDMVHQAQEKLHQNSLLSKSPVSSARQSLERIKAKQQETQAYNEVVAELSELDSLDTKAQHNQHTQNENTQNTKSDAIEIIARLKRSSASGDNV